MRNHTECGGRIYMHAKKHIKHFSTTALLIKSTGIMRLVPLIALDVFALGLILLSGFGREEQEETLMDFLLVSQFFFPVFSIWWPVFILREFTDANGSELIYTICRKSLLAYIMQPFLILLFNVVALCGICTAFCSVFVWEFARIISVCIFYFGLIYCVSMFSRSTSISLFTIIIYTLACMVFRGEEPSFPLYMSQWIIQKSHILNVCVPLLICAVILIAAGKLSEKKLYTNL